jgi:hypothetical protein
MYSLRFVKSSRWDKITITKESFIRGDFSMFASNRVKGAHKP